VFQRSERFDFPISMKEGRASAALAVSAASSAAFSPLWGRRTRGSLIRDPSALRFERRIVAGLRAPQLGEGGVLAVRIALRLSSGPDRCLARFVLLMGGRYGARDGKETEQIGSVLGPELLTVISSWSCFNYGSTRRHAALR